MIEVSMKCPCGTHAVVDTTGSYQANDKWACHCPNCIDPTEDGERLDHLQGYGATHEEAIADWWHKVEEAWDIDWRLTAVGNEFTQPVFDLWAQVKLEAERQRGWQTRDSWLMPGTDKWHGPKLTVSP